MNDAVDQAVITAYVVRSAYPYLQTVGNQTITARTSVIEFRPLYVNNSFATLTRLSTDNSSIALRRSLHRGFVQSITNPQTIMNTSVGVQLVVTGGTRIPVIAPNVDQLFLELKDDTLPAGPAGGLAD